MAGSRARARDLLVRAIYQWQIAGHEFSELVDQYQAMSEFRRVDADYFTAVLQAVVENSAVLDEVILKFAERGLEQLDTVGRAVLLIAVAELKFFADVPPKVVINEAVKLAKRYGPADSYRFVNAVTDRAAQLLRDPSPGDA